MDAVIARLFTSYRGKIRTFNETEATIKIVPFLAASNYRCSQLNKGRNDNSTDILSINAQNFSTTLPRSTFS